MNELLILNDIEWNENVLYIAYKEFFVLSTILTKIQSLYLIPKL